MRYVPDMKVTLEADSGLKALELYGTNKPAVVLLAILSRKAAFGSVRQPFMDKTISSRKVCQGNAIT